jgi:dethiobiotin synthetase
VANRIDPAMQAQEENIAWLQRQLAAPLLADIACQDAPDPRAIAIHLP